MYRDSGGDDDIKSVEDIRKIVKYGPSLGWVRSTAETGRASRELCGGRKPIRKLDGKCWFSARITPK